MLVELLDSVQNNKISAIKTNFWGNYCFERQECSGGGIALGFMFYSHAHETLPANNSFSCSYCTFEYNRANHMGGGVAVFVTTESKSGKERSSITFSDCSWTNNTSPVGAAVYISPAVWDFGYEGFLPIPVFSNCSFESNSAYQNLSSHSNGLITSSLGNGAFFISELHVRFEGSTMFRNNVGSAVYLTDSTLEFSKGSTVSFISNSAHNGGAIAMYASSVIHITNDSMFNFTNNEAYSSGGAIYTSVAAVLQSTYRNCFIQSVSQQYFKTTSILKFKGNYAHMYGHSLFATTLGPCKELCPKQTPVDDPEDILQCIADFNFTNKTSSIATRPISFTLHETTPVKIIPGSEYCLNISVTDEADNSLSGIVYGAAVSSHGNVHMNPAFSEVSNNITSLLGTIGDDAVLYLDTSDISLSLNITLIDCKPGYITKNDTCECAASDYLGLITCEPNIKHGYWMGFCSNNSTELCTTFCPYGFCSYHGMIPNASIHPLPNNSNLLDSQICGPNKTDRVCSKCVGNHSVYFHSMKYSCGPEDLCYLGWFFYLISEILPVTLIFVIILVFNISFTNGNVNCFVFYAQILDTLATNVNRATKFPRTIEVIQTILTFFYRPFNLDFFYLEQLSYCLWKGATVMDALLMKYATVGFALVLVVLTILIAKYRCGQFKIFAKLHTPNSVLIHGLSAFFVMCYSQSARVTFHILDYFCLYSINFKCEVKVVYLIGNMNYLEGEHIKYAIIALFVSVFMIIIPPLLLIVYPLVFKLLGLCKLSESKLAGILWRVMPIQLLDSFQSSFKDNFRFFAGLYFFYRTIVLAANAYCREPLQFYSVVQLQLILILAVHAIFQPYKEKNHNIIDTLLITDLGIINAISLYTTAEKDFTFRHISHAAVIIMALIQAVLIILPFLCVIVLGIVKLIKWKKHVSDVDELPSLRSVESTPLLQCR